MITEGTLKALLARRTELKNLDYKQSMNWASASNEEKCELVKDILAMMNTQDGGQIIIGVEDKTCDAIGLADPDVASFDPTKVNDFVHKYADPLASCQVQKLTLGDRKFIVIDVLEFADVPIICKADANSAANKVILKRGGLYIRTDKPTSELVSSVEEMRDMVSRALLKRGDHLLRMIQGLIAGRPIVAPNELDGYKQEIEDAEAFFSGIFPTDVQNSHWDLDALPTPYSKDRVPDIATLADALARSKVLLRGWSFPHSNPLHTSNFSQGRQSFTLENEGPNGRQDAFRASTSGLFMWRGSYWEGALGAGTSPRRILSWVNVIYQITEFFVFLSRYYARIADDATLNVTIRLTDTKGRVLMSMDDFGELFDNYVCTENKIELTDEYSVSELRASPEDVARPFIRRVFEVFQWTDVRDDVIQQRQRQLIERRF